MVAIETNINTATVEYFARLIIEKQATFIDLKEKVSLLQLSENQTQILLQRLDWAKERIHKSLDFNEIFFYTIIPLGILHNFSKQYFFDAEKEMRLGFKRKVGQYYTYSILGIFVYLSMFLVPFIYNTAIHND